MRNLRDRIYVEPLKGKDIPIGSVLIMYSSAQRKIFDHVLKDRLDREGIPYFLDKEQIKPGDTWLDNLEQLYRATSCGIPILTPTSMKSPWVLYEIGVLSGKDKKIVPFMYTANLSDKEKERFLKSLPEFISRLQWSDEPENVVDVIKGHIFHIENLFEDQALDKKVIKKLVQLKLAIELEECSADLAHDISFGYQIVRFGRWEFQQKEPFDSELSETDRLHKIFYKHEKMHRSGSQILKVEFAIPVHRKWGTTFKLFVDMDELKLATTVQQLLVRNGFTDVQQSHSGEKQRIYFLIPQECDAVKIVEEPYEGVKIQNNYVFPV